MRLRFLAAFAVIAVLMTTLTPTAQATVGPKVLQRLSIAQTQLLFRFYQGPPQVASPATCRAADNEHGVFLLPTLSFGSGDRTFRCRIEATAALVDLGGAVATEDGRGDTYALANGEVVTFTRANLSRICDDALQYYPTAAPATLDGRTVSGVPVSTATFLVKVNPGSRAQPNTPYYQDSVDLGHPGTLAACFTGQKAIVPLTPGRHTLRVDLTGADGAPSRFAYYLDVHRPR